MHKIILRLAMLLSMHLYPGDLGANFVPDSNSIYGGISTILGQWTQEKDILYNHFVLNSHDSANLFKLALAHDRLGDWQAAHRFYELRSQSLGDSQELFVSLLKLGDDAQRLPEDKGWAQALSYYLRAYAVQSDRIEPLIRIAQHYLQKTDHSMAYGFAHCACLKPYPVENALGFEKHLYDFTRYEILGISAWYVQAFQEGEAAARLLTAQFPDNQHVKENLKYYEQRNEWLSEHKQIKDTRIPDHFGVGFHIAMKLSPRYSEDFIEKYPFWKLVKDRYEKYVIAEVNYRQEPRIPKIIHQIWLGSPLPDKYKSFQQSWMKHNPGWEYRLWTEKELEEFGLRNKAIFDASSNWATKSDIARYEILYRIGGVYADTDFECLRSFEVLHHCCDFYAGFESEGSFEGEDILLIGNALIGAAPGHPILKQCVDNIRGNDGAKEDWYSVMTKTSPHYFSQIIKKELPECNRPTVIFPSSYFYPWPGYRGQRSADQVIKWIRPETFAVHYWEGSWI